MSRGLGVPDGARAWVITVSDRAFSGAYADTSGPLLADALSAMGFSVVGRRVVPDEEEMIVDALATAVASRSELVVTTGGTGLAPRDVTPEATRRVVEREVPGIAEALRAAGRETVAAAMLSRGVAGVSGTTLVVNLPGSTGGVRDGVAILGTVVAHAVSQIRGVGDHGRGGSDSHGPDSHGHGPDSHGHGPDSHGHGPDSHGHGPDSHGHGRAGDGERVARGRE